MHTPEKSKARSVGGYIPEDLYWEFKQVQAARHESTTKALEVAIRLYVDAIPGTQKDEEVQNG